LEITLVERSAKQVAVNEFAKWDLTITNRGDGVARNIVVEDRFDQGLTHPNDTSNVHAVKTDVRPLAPNDTETLPLTFQVVAAGQLCHDVTVTADGPLRETERGCVTGIAPAATALAVRVSGPRRATVGDVAKFNIVIRNTGSTNAANVEVRLEFPAEIEPLPENDAQRLADGSVVMRLSGDLAATERRELPIRGQCRGPSNNACIRVNVSAAGGTNSYDQACVEILPAISGSLPGATGSP
jgi:uncharacterized repeat protein (TIGR01451 family)